MSPPIPANVADRPTRPPLAWWDRVKFILLFVGVWVVLLWTLYVEDPNITLADAALERVDTARLWLVLAGLELVRQLHYALSERSEWWHGLWARRVFGGLNRFAQRFDDWTRFRLARLAKLLVGVVALAFVLGAVTDRSPATVLFELPALAVAGLPFVLQLAFAFFYVIFQFVGLFWFLSRGGVDVYMPGDITTRFDDVWGQDAVVERLRENLIFLENPEAIEAKGGYVPGGILLWGPPGTGKTLMAEAVAGETGKPFVFVDPGAFINMFMGVGILKVKGLFRKLRRLAVRYGGVVVFFDEADSLGSRGALGPGPAPGAGASAFPWRAGCNGASWLDPATQRLLHDHAAFEAEAGADARRSRFVVGGMGGGGMGTLQALLTELSGLKKPRGFLNRVVRRAMGMQPKPPPKYRILVMMATNMPQALDEALLRPGRIDRMYKVGYPSKAGRVRTYQGYFAKVAHELADDDIEKLATITPYATGATIKDLVNESLIAAIGEGRDVITWRDVVKAKHRKELGPPEDVEYIERERHAVAVHEACHAVVAHRVRRHLTIDLATIEKGGNYLGMVASIPPEDQFTRWRSEYEADIMVALASLAGERLFFGGDNSSGVSGDLQSATLVATYMEGYWGMGSTVASHGVTTQHNVGGGGPAGGDRPGRDRRKPTDALEGSLGRRIETKLAELLARTEQLLAADRLAVLGVAHALETHKTLTGDDVAAVIDGTQGPLVDGRPYRSLAFQAEVETYHALALEAHRSHAAVGVLLPALPAVPDDPAAASAAAARANGNGVRVSRPRAASASADRRARRPRRPSP